MTRTYHQAYNTVHAQRLNTTMYAHTCTTCGNPFEHRLPHAKTCSAACRRAMHRENNGLAARDAFNPDTAKGAVGAMHEMLVCVELLRQGFYAFRSVAANSPFDIVAYAPGGQCVRIEVTTGRRSSAGALTHPPKDSTKFDVLAIVEHSGAITFLPELVSNGLV